ncbi:MAG: hypothetical protein JKX73_03470, partial [Flavobacteriales bacterium]|nr:hypothetical protein [Flavobacteriales bacterium]
MNRLITIFLLFPVLSLAQYKPVDGLLFSIEYSAPSRTEFSVGKLTEVNDRAVREFIGSHSQLDLNNSSLVLLDRVESPIGWHYNYKQQHNGVDVFGGGYKVNVDFNGRIRSITNNLIRVEKNLSTEFPEKMKFIQHYASVMHANCYFHYDGRLVPSLRMEMEGPNYAKFEIIIDREGEVLYVQDLNRHLMTDSTVTAKVYLPDPLTTAGKIYGGAYADNADADNSELNDERFDVTMTVDFSNDTFRLTSSRVEIQNFANPSTVVAFTDTPVFNFTRSQFEFEDVNCFYHLTVYQNYMQSLGFSLVNYQIGVDAHAFTADNSMFSYPKLYFGDGCVDDGEDADVIIHEYGHAITASAAPNTWIGSERKALDEAAGDYLATSYTRDLNPFNWELMFGWDGNNACWPGRTAATTKTYPSGITGDIHKDGEIWSSTLMQIWEVLGRETTDKIFLQSLYSYAQNISMTDAAYMFLDADSALNGGVNYITCYYWFEKRGILPPLPFFSGTDGNGMLATCNGICDASAVVLPISGVAPFTYAWKDSLGASLGGNSDTLMGMCAG